jgi:PII-like signaling protein
VTQPAWKLSAYFPERQRSITDSEGGTRPTYLADEILELFDHHKVATSVMLRGISSFGPVGVLRSDESLTLSEDPPAVIYAVDVESTIAPLVGEVVAMTGRGLVTLERAQLVRGGAIPDLPSAGEWDAIKLSVYVGRTVRVGRTPAFRAICDVLYRRGFAVASALLGVDGTAHGVRYRAQFWSRNVNVPMMIVAVGSPQEAAGALEELTALVPGPLLTIERIELCKRKGVLLRCPGDLPATDEQGRPLWQKLMVHTTEGDTYDGAPIHRQIVRRLLASRTAQGATAMRGVWGFRSERQPHGDKLFQIVRRVPVVTVIVDTPAAIARSFEIVDELTTEHGVVTCEMVPAALSIQGPGRRGTLQPANHHY